MGRVGCGRRRTDEHLEHHHERADHHEEGVDEHREDLREDLGGDGEEDVGEFGAEHDEEHSKVEERVVERCRLKGGRHEVVLALGAERGEPARRGEAKDEGVVAVVGGVGGVGARRKGGELRERAAAGGGVGARGVGVAARLFGRLEPRAVGGGAAAPLGRLGRGRAVEPGVRKVGLAEEALPVLPREGEREDLEHEHDGRLRHVKGRGVPHGQHARVDDVHRRVVEDARGVPRELGRLEEQGAIVKGLLGIAVHPQEDLVHDEEHEEHGEQRERALAELGGRVHARPHHLEGAHGDLPHARREAVGRAAAALGVGDQRLDVVPLRLGESDVGAVTAHRGAVIVVLGNHARTRTCTRARWCCARHGSRYRAAARPRYWARVARLLISAAAGPLPSRSLSRGPLVARSSATTRRSSWPVPTTRARARPGARS